MLLQNLKNFIKKKGGWIPFDTFMFECLYGSQNSYYIRNHSMYTEMPFGKSGDFITSSSLGRWMAKAYANSYERVLNKTPRIDQNGLKIREYGPGNGDLAAKILIELFERGKLPEKYELIEISESFMQVQKKNMARILKAHNESLLKKANEILEWKPVSVNCKKFITDAYLHPIEGLIIANEIIDSFPVKIALWYPNDEILELGVKINNKDDLEFQQNIAEEKLVKEVLQRKGQAKENGHLWKTPRMLDICLHTESWLASLMKTFSAGELIISDYGLERYELDSDNRIESNVTAFTKHSQIPKLVDCLKNAGNQDLTYLIDFSQLTKFFLERGDCRFNLKTQTAWLIDSGALNQITREYGSENDEQKKIEELGNLQKLMSDNEMGQSFLFFHVFKRRFS